jgi:hypothetical protein
MRTRWLWALLPLSCLFGCESPPEPLSIVPDSTRGRQAIDATISTWKSGHQTGIVEPTSPRVQVVDNHRKPGQKVIGYEILGDSADARVRTFTVRMTLSEPDESPTVRFLVVGIDPILVFRQEDYDMMMHWEHKMEPEPENTGPPPGPPSK